MPAAGIDVGKEGFDLCYATEGNPAKWKVQHVSYAADDWTAALKALDGYTVAIEPTGWHYSAPIVAVLQQARAHVWFIDHAVTGQQRNLTVSNNKNDQMDARALAVIADNIQRDQPPRRARPYDPDRDPAVTALRLMVNQRAQLLKDRTRSTNRARALGHSMHPALGQSDTWFTLVRVGYVTPAEILAGIDGQAVGHLHPNTWTAIGRLQRKLHPLPVHPVTRTRAVDAVREIDALTATIDQLEAAIEEVVTLNPLFADVTARWLTIPNITTMAAAAFHVAARGRAHEMTADEFKAACGQYPQRFASGKSDKSKPARRGNRSAMQAIHLITMQLVRENAQPNPIKDYHAKKQDFAATKAKLATLISGIARHDQPYTYRG